MICTAAAIRFGPPSRVRISSFQLNELGATCVEKVIGLGVDGSVDRRGDGPKEHGGNGRVDHEVVVHPRDPGEPRAGKVLEAGYVPERSVIEPPLRTSGVQESDRGDR